MSDEFLDKYDLHWKLRRVKRFIVVLGVVVFIFINWGKTFLLIEFVWTCFLSRRHNLSVEATYAHVEIAAEQAGASFAYFLLCMCAVWLAHVLIDTFFAPVDLTEAELEDRRSSAMRRYKLLIREARSLEPAEKLVAENAILRSELSSLHEAIVRLRLEMDNIDRKKAKKMAQPINQKTQDLFDEVNRTAPKTTRVKSKISARLGRKRPAPEL